MPLHDPVRDRERETASGPIEVSRGVATVEALEDVRRIVHGLADTDRRPWKRIDL